MSADEQRAVPSGVTRAPAEASSWRPRAIRAVAVLAIGLAALVLLGWVLGVVLVPRIATADVNGEAELVTRDHHLVVLLAAVSLLGTGFTITVVGCVVAGLLLRARTPALVTFVAVSAVGATVLTQILKSLVDRPRPAVAQVSAAGSSFPSGHSTEAAAFYGAVAFIAACAVSDGRRRAIILVGTVLLVLAIAFSRLALGVHYPSDVLTGLLLGGLWLIVTMIATGAPWVGRDRARPQGRHAAYR